MEFIIRKHAVTLEEFNNPTDIKCISEEISDKSFDEIKIDLQKKIWR